MESRLRKKRKIRLKGTLLENQIYTTLDMSSNAGSLHIQELRSVAHSFAVG